MNNEFGWFNIILAAFGVKKIRLISYTSEPLNPLCDGISFVLNLRTTWLWGLLTTSRSINKAISPFGNVSNYVNHWDKLIKNKSIIDSIRL